MANVQRRERRRGLASVLVNGLRGKQTMVDAILGIHRAVTSHRTEVLGEIPPIFRQSAFKIPEDDFGTALDVKTQHLNQIEKLSRNGSPVVELNYLKLATSYILSNPDRVNAWLELNRAASTESFAGDAENIQTLLLNLAPIDQQSLASMKLYAALHSLSDDVIKEYLARHLPSFWAQNRFLYPLIYYIVHLPDAHAFDQMLMHYYPNGGTGPAERILTRFLLQPEEPSHANLALRCYVALISHPYDALEYVVADLERRCVEGGSIDTACLEQFALLAEAFPEHRIAALVRLAGRTSLPFADRPNSLSGFAFEPGSAEETVLLSALDARCEKAPDFVPRTQLMAALFGARWSRYPDPKHFEELAAYHQRFAILASGRLIRHIATSLFLFMRTNPAHERLSLLQGLLLTGCWTPFCVSGPQGYIVARGNRTLSDLSSTEILERTAEILTPDAEARSDRVWIKAANWSLMDAQVNGRMRAWAEQARPKFPVWVQPRYLSGLDWSWLSDMIGVLGMRSLVGNVDMIRILFLRQLEEFRRESVPLRLAIEPFARAHRPVEEMSAWLHEHFGADTSALVRFFLTPDTILKLRLTDNYMAAVSYRLELLERAVIEYDFKVGVFEPDDLEREQNILTAMLCRMSVGARQFEIAWDRLAESAEERNRDAYSAYDTLVQAIPEDSQLNRRRSSPYQFSNGAAAEYESGLRDWPLVLVIGGIIDTFLTHPTTGIEAILSVRIRHDAFRREYETEMHRIENGAIAGVGSDQTRSQVPRFAPTVYREVQRWLDMHMHASRREKQHAIFNFMPTKAEMTALIDDAKNKSLPEIVDLVFHWIRPRLDRHLSSARKSLRALGATIEKRIHSQRGELPGGGRDDSDAKRIADALSAALIRRSGDLEEWFKIPESERDKSLCVEEVMNAVRQRFSLNQATAQLRWGNLPATVSTRSVAPHHVRHLYDLMSEIIQNARKHSGTGKTVIRISRPGGINGQSLVISNRKTAGAAREETIEGHPDQMRHDSLFGERKSGLKKIAYLAASIAEAQASIKVHERDDYFHLILPIDAVGRAVP